MKTLLIILQLVPVLISAIRSVEELIPEGGKGKEKLALIQNIMTTSYEGISEVWPIVAKVISSIVETANIVGSFKTTKS